MPLANVFVVQAVAGEPYTCAGAVGADQPAPVTLGECAVLIQADAACTSQGFEYKKSVPLSAGTAHCKCCPSLSLDALSAASGATWIYRVAENAAATPAEKAGATATKPITELVVHTDADEWLGCPSPTIALRQKGSATEWPADAKEAQIFSLVDTDTNF